MLIRHIIECNSHTSVERTDFRLNSLRHLGCVNKNNP